MKNMNSPYNFEMVYIIINQNELFSQNINPKMDIFNQLDINRDNVLTKQELMNGVIDLQKQLMAL